MPCLCDTLPASVSTQGGHDICHPGELKAETSFVVLMPLRQVRTLYKNKKGCGAGTTRGRGCARGAGSQVGQARRPRGTRVGAPPGVGHVSRRSGAGPGRCPGHSDNRDCLCDSRVTSGQVTPRHEQPVGAPGGIW